MSALRVVPGEVISDVSASRADAVVGLPVHALVLHAAPQALDEHVVAPCTATVHGQLAAGIKDNAGELFGGELAALVCVDDLRRAVSGQGLLNHFLGMDRLQRDRQLVRQHAAAGHVHHRGGIHNRRAIGMYVVSSAETWLVRVIARLRSTFAQHAGTHGRVLQVQIVDAAHERHVSIADRRRQVIHRTAAHASSCA